MVLILAIVDKIFKTILIMPHKYKPLKSKQTTSIALFICVKLTFILLNCSRFFLLNYSTAIFYNKSGFQKKVV